MIFDRDRTIGGLRLLKVPFQNDPEILDIIESAVFYLKSDAPVECETYNVVDEDTGRVLSVERFCGKCTHRIPDGKDFCPHCGKKVKKSGYE